MQLARSYHATRRMDTRRLLVTGGGGFVGLKLCQELTRRGYKVTALDVKFLSDEALATEQDKNIDKVEVLIVPYYCHCTLQYRRLILLILAELMK